VASEVPTERSVDGPLTVIDSELAAPSTQTFEPIAIMYAPPRMETDDATNAANHRFPLVDSDEVTVTDAPVMSTVAAVCDPYPTKLKSAAETVDEP
jgi:hypothetical protein